MIDIRSKEEWAEEKNACVIGQVLKGNMTPNKEAVIEKLRRNNGYLRRKMPVLRGSDTRTGERRRRSGHPGNSGLYLRKDKRT